MIPCIRRCISATTAADYLIGITCPNPIWLGRCPCRNLLHSNCCCPLQSLFGLLGGGSFEKTHEEQYRIQKPRRSVSSQVKFRDGSDRTNSNNSRQLINQKSAFLSEPRDSLLTEGVKIALCLPSPLFSPNYRKSGLGSTLGWQVFPAHWRLFGNRSQSHPRALYPPPVAHVSQQPKRQDGPRLKERKLPPTRRRNGKCQLRQSRGFVLLRGPGGRNGENGRRRLEVDRACHIG